MPRYWTCRGCKAVNNRTKQKCPHCGRKRPARKVPAHRRALDIPYEEYARRYGEACGICGKKATGGRRLHRDHDHKTGEPRGLLCFPCNRALPNYLDADWLEKALAYLRRT